MPHKKYLVTLTPEERDYLALKNRSSVLGTYSINSSGDTSLVAYTVSHVVAGKLVPFKALQEQG